MHAVGHAYPVPSQPTTGGARTCTAGITEQRQGKLCAFLHVEEFVFSTLLLHPFAVQVGGDNAQE